MSAKICFLIGHRDTPKEVFPVLQQTVRRHITEYGVTEFLVGHYGRFDQMAKGAVLSAKEDFPQIKLTLLTPYYSPQNPGEMLPGFDSILYPPGMERVPKRLAIVRANRYAVDCSRYLIAYISHPASNARNVLEYARQRERRGLIFIENLGELEL